MCCAKKKKKKLKKSCCVLLTVNRRHWLTAVSKKKKKRLARDSGSKAIYHRLFEVWLGSGTSRPAAMILFVLEALRAFASTREASVALFVPRRTPWGCLPRPIKLHSLLVWGLPDDGECSTLVCLAGAVSLRLGEPTHPDPRTPFKTIICCVFWRRAFGEKG